MNPLKPFRPKYIDTCNLYHLDFGNRNRKNTLDVQEIGNSWYKRNHVLICKIDEIPNQFSICRKISEFLCSLSIISRQELRRATNCAVNCKSGAPSSACEICSQTSWLLRIVTKSLVKWPPGGNKNSVKTKESPFCIWPLAFDENIRWLKP